jgi:hypothetical protein
MISIEENPVLELEQILSANGTLSNASVALDLYKVHGLERRAQEYANSFLKREKEIEITLKSVLGKQLSESKFELNEELSGLNKILNDIKNGEYNSINEEAVEKSQQFIRYATDIFSDILEKTQAPWYF